MLENDRSPRITIVGTGPGSLKYLTAEASDALLAAEKVFFRISDYPVYQWLKRQGKHLLCFDVLYSTPFIKRSGVIYSLMADAIIKESEIRGNACYAVPGNPGVLEDTTKQLRQSAAQRGITTEIIPGMSFLDLIYAELDINPVGLQIVLPRTHLQPGIFNPLLSLLVCQLDPSVTMQSLLKNFPPDHLVTLIWTDGPPDYNLLSKCVRLNELADEATPAMYFASLYVPGLKTL